MLMPMLAARALAEAAGVSAVAAATDTRRNRRRPLAAATRMDAAAAATSPSWRAWRVCATHLRATGRKCPRAAAFARPRSGPVGCQRLRSLTARRADAVIARTVSTRTLAAASVVLVSTLWRPAPGHSRPRNVNCLTAYHGKLLLSDDGQQATLQLWDVVGRRRVQEVGGIRKWNAPTSIPYMGLDKSFWVRDNTLCTMNWMAIAGSDAMEPAA